MEKKIVVKRRKTLNSQCQTQLTPEACACLVEIMQETGMSAKQLASTIIIQAVQGDMILYEDDNSGGETE